MQPLSILLLLLCILQAAADGTPPCDRSLIKGDDLSKVNYVSDSNTLTISCAAGENYLMAIEFNSTRYVSLTCDKTGGWKAKSTKDDGKGELIVAEASKPLNIECVKYCVATGVGIYIDKSHNYGIEDSLDVYCTDSYTYQGKDVLEQLFYGQMRMAQATCLLGDEFEWIFYLSKDFFDHNEKVFLNGSGKQENFECRLEPPPAIAYEITKMKATTSPADNMIPSMKDSRHKCDPSLIKAVDSSEFHFDDATGLLTCIGGANSLMAIKINNTRYSHLECDRIYGWKATYNELGIIHYDRIQDYSIPMHIACVEYCAADGTGIKAAETFKLGSPHLEISCDDPFPIELFHGQKHILEAECSLLDGWTWKYGHKDNYISNGRFDTNKPKFECKKDSRLKCDRSLINVVDSAQITFDDTSKSLACDGGENSPRAIQIDTNRYATLTCDESEGWKAKKLNDDGNWEFYTIAESTSILNFACVKYCMPTGGIKVEKTNDFKNNGEIEISCASQFLYREQKYSETLFYRQKQLSGAYCSFDGWKLYVDQSDDPLIRLYLGEPFEFECRLMLPTSTTPTTTTTERMENGDSAETVTTTTTTPSTTGKPAEKDSFAAAKSETQSSLIVVGCSVGGFVLGGIVVIVIFIIYRNLLLSNKNLPNNEKSVKSTEEGRKKNKKRGSNVENLSDVDNSSSGR